MKYIKNFFIFILSFFYDSDWNPMPPYFWITVIMSAICFDVWRKVIENKLTLPFLGTVLGFVTAWLAIYTWNKNSRKNVGE